MKSAVVDQSLSKIQYGGQRAMCEPKDPFPSFKYLSRKQKKTTNDAHSIELLHSKKLLNVSFLLLLLLSQRNKHVITHVPRSCRRLSRNTGWWDKVWNTYSDARFKITFRKSHTAFTFILDRIEGPLPNGISPCCGPWYMDELYW